MGKISSKLTSITFGTGPNPPVISRGTITNGTFGINVTGNALGTEVEFSALKVWNAVWNDVADFQLLSDKLEYGKCYFDTKDGARICNTRCQMSMIGIASDTFGFGVGGGANPNHEVPIAVAGWVLAFVDQEYDCGTPLTNDANGNLTAMTKQEKLEYPERITGLYKRREMDKLWGPEDKQIEVKGRHWIKVK